jgi:hypothetical protein
VVASTGKAAIKTTSGHGKATSFVDDDVTRQGLSLTNMNFVRLSHERKTALNAHFEITQVPPRGLQFWVAATPRRNYINFLLPHVARVFAPFFQNSNAGIDLLRSLACQAPLKAGESSCRRARQWNIYFLRNEVVLCTILWVALHQVQSYLW